MFCIDKENDLCSLVKSLFGCMCQRCCQSQMAACWHEAFAAMHMFVLFVHLACMHSKGSRSSREAGEPRSQVQTAQH